jgi:ABC-type nitrate/sulfonate/bicarbonate transport system, permease component
MNRLLALRAAVVSLTLLGAVLFLWHDLTRSTSPRSVTGITQSRPVLPGPLDVGSQLLEHLRDPLSIQHPGEKGLVLHLAASLAHAVAGFLLAVLVALPLGVLTGLSPLFSRSLAPSFNCCGP